MLLPDLNSIWETFVEIGPPECFGDGAHITVLRDHIIPTLSTLRSEGTIRWYGFHIHGYLSGVPTNPDDRNGYWHVRFESRVAGPEEILRSLPHGFTNTRPVPRQSLIEVGGLSVGILATNDVRVQWGIIGEITEFLVHLVSFYRADASPREIYEDLAQHIHFLCNACGLWPSPSPMPQSER
jgi:hypothetical protein